MTKVEVVPTITLEHGTAAHSMMFLCTEYKELWKECMFTGLKEPCDTLTKIFQPSQKSSPAVYLPSSGILTGARELSNPSLSVHRGKGKGQREKKKHSVKQCVTAGRAPRQSNINSYRSIKSAGAEHRSMKTSSKNEQSISSKSSR